MTTATTNRIRHSPENPAPLGRRCPGAGCYRLRHAEHRYCEPCRVKHRKPKPPRDAKPARPRLRGRILADVLARISPYVPPSPSSNTKYFDPNEPLNFDDWLRAGELVWIVAKPKREEKGVTIEREDYSRCVVGTKFVAISKHLAQEATAPS